jgi:hypothetical protein
VVYFLDANSIYIERDANARTRTSTSAKKTYAQDVPSTDEIFFSASPGCCRCLENSSDVQFIKNQPFSRRVSIGRQPWRTGGDLGTHRGIAPPPRHPRPHAWTARRPQHAAALARSAARLVAGGQSRHPAEPDRRTSGARRPQRCSPRRRPDPEHRAHGPPPLSSRATVSQAEQGFVI